MNVSFSVNIAFPNGSPEITTLTQSAGAITRQKLEFSDVLAFETIEEIPEEPQNVTEEPKADLIIFDPSPVASDCSESDFAESSFLSSTTMQNNPQENEQKTQSEGAKNNIKNRNNEELNNEKFKFPKRMVSQYVLNNLEKYINKQTYKNEIEKAAYSLLLYNIKKFVFYERFNGYFLPYPAIENNTDFQKEKLYKYLKDNNIICYRTGPYRHYYSKSILLNSQEYTKLSQIYDKIEKGDF